ncbi:hypothetical protein BJ684DRAFT_18507 [Piptocephalis cylindrospora]|uniref:Uncharacterized protein n=1 Tax=Piptocephalis cylindrospora TaxID=1907219 RepID=A0A4P9Y7M2_9FUNG|nr:hypothetical protein BJ684DRAFT_18507 [Piptocephalis cylindrospora]|eukprot:RKP15136.1 hypothetical protein BJ684DRAFT_18507 [Piptocephalis cylindrospora]
MFIQTSALIAILSVLSMTHGAPIDETIQDAMASGDYALGQGSACFQGEGQNIQDASSGCPQTLRDVSEFTPPAVEVRPAPITYTPPPAILQPSPLSMQVTAGMQGPAQFEGGEGGQLLEGGQMADLGSFGGENQMRGGCGFGQSLSPCVV